MNQEFLKTISLDFINWFKCNLAYQLSLKSFHNNEILPEHGQNVMDFVLSRNIISSEDDEGRILLLEAALRKDKAHASFECMVTLSKQYLTDDLGTLGYQKIMNPQSDRQSKVINLGLGFIEYQSADRVHLAKIKAKSSETATRPLEDHIREMHVAGEYKQNVYHSLINNVSELLGLTGLNDDEAQKRCKDWFN